MRIKIGDIYEDCAYHPVVCSESKGDDIAGYSLFDGSYPRSCSIKDCAIRLLNPDQVGFKIKNRERWLSAEKNWHTSGEQDWTDYRRLWTEEDALDSGLEFKEKLK